MEKHVYFVRHGESNSNKDGLLRGSESGLTDEGKKQAEIVAARVGRIGVDALISSKYARTLDTAEAIARVTRLQVQKSDLLVEWRQPSAIMGKHKDDPMVRQIHAEIHAGRMTPGYRHSDEESFSDMKARAVGTLELLRNHPKDRLCVVTHGIFLRVLLGTTLLGDRFSEPDFRNFMTHLLTSNTGITYARYRDDIGFRGYPTESGWEFISWNDAAHLG
ncbi:MAG TPA: histidine phosphatase family protein [Candidatus Paceibacterota bacterium]|nr:histidine phosphatase family protein [Candidatus Paceibacterota bacterium]